MNYLVLFKMIPDTVEELELSDDQKSLNTEYLRYKLSDADEHALEQALILKERHGGQVTVAALDAPEVDDVLFTAIAKGADVVVKIALDQTKLDTRATAQAMAAWIKASNLVGGQTLVMPGAQAIDDLGGELGAWLAEELQLPFIGVVSSVKLDDNCSKALVLKEFSSGLRGEFEVPLPAILGIQSAEKPPRYVPVAKVRMAMKTAKIQSVEVAAAPVSGLAIERMFKPEVAGHAEMLEGTPDEVAEKLAGILAERGII